jgi:hypothetical protein
VVRNRGYGGYVDWPHLVDFLANAERQRLERLPIKLSNKQEITMTQNKQNKDANTATTNSTFKSRFGHWVRVVVMFLSFGFIFPHAMTEDMDIAKHDIDKDAKAKKQ